MREYIVDAILILVGVVLLVLGWWLLIHNSDRKLLRTFRRYGNPGMSRDELIASRSLNLAFFAIIVKLIGTVLLMAGVLRFFGFGRT